jgi:hypothetical protein
MYPAGGQIGGDSCKRAADGEYPSKAPRVSLARSSRSTGVGAASAQQCSRAEFAVGSRLPGTARALAARAVAVGTRAAGDPDHSTVLADPDPELHGLPLGIPAGVAGERRWETVHRAL